ALLPPAGNDLLLGALLDEECLSPQRNYSHTGGLRLCSARNSENQKANPKCTNLFPIWICRHKSALCVLNLTPPSRARSTNARSASGRIQRSSRRISRSSAARNIVSVSTAALRRCTSA